jgi:hypothetical protein
MVFGVPSVSLSVWMDMHLCYCLSGWTDFIIFSNQEFIHSRLLSQEYEHSNAFRLARKHKMAIFSETAQNIVITFM